MFCLLPRRHNLLHAFSIEIDNGRNEILAHNDTAHGFPVQLVFAQNITYWLDGHFDVLWWANERSNLNELLPLDSFDGCKTVANRRYGWVFVAELSSKSNSWSLHSRMTSTLTGHFGVTRYVNTTSHYVSTREDSWCCEFLSSTMLWE